MYKRNKKKKNKAKKQKRKHALSTKFVARMENFQMKRKLEKK
jgi:hypothetical protein